MNLRSVDIWHKIKALFVLSILTLSLGMTFSSAFAQDRNVNDVGTGMNTTRVADEGFDFGWIGLAGLAGLVGLMPHDRADRRVNELKR